MCVSFPGDHHTTTPCFDLRQGFSCRGAELEGVWSAIPEEVDILLTHMPPYNRLDLAFDPGSTAKDNPCPVSYTHLTLPTIYSV